MAFGVGKVHALIVGGSSSLALAPLRLHGARVTIVENTSLTCSYTAADGSVVTFDGGRTVGTALTRAEVERREKLGRRRARAARACRRARAASSLGLPSATSVLRPQTDRWDDRGRGRRRANGGN